MAVIINPNYQNPQIGQIASNLATAIFGDPEARMKRDYYGSEMALNDAQRGKYGEETRGLRLKNDATVSLPTTLGNLFRVVPGETPEARMARVGTEIAPFLTAGGGNADQLAQGAKSVLSSIFALGSNDDMARSLVLDGKMPGPDFAPTMERADAITARDASEDRTTKFGEANIKARSDANVANINNAGSLARVFAAPLNIPAGNTVYLAPGDPRAKSVGGTKAMGVPTTNTVRGEAGTRLLAGDKAPGLAGIFNGSGGAGPAKGGMTQAQAIAQARKDFENYRGNDPNKKVYNLDGSEAQPELWITDRAKHYLAGMGAQPAPAVGVPAAPAAAAPQQIPPPAQRPVGFRARGADGVEREWNGQVWIDPRQGA